MTLNIAHRGFSGWYPENTLLAFSKALDLGVQAIELDVQLSRDGEVMIFHDEDLQRITGVRGWLKDLTRVELKQLDAAGEFKGVYGKNSIPTLDEYLELTAGVDVITFIELKNSMVLYPGLEEKVANRVEAFRQNAKVILYSANHRSVKHFGSLAPEVKLLFPFDNWIYDYGAYCRKHGITRCMPYFRALNPVIVAEIKANGVKLYPWTVDDPADMRSMIELGVDGMLTNRPDLLQQVITQYATTGAS